MTYPLTHCQTATSSMLTNLLRCSEPYARGGTADPLHCPRTTDLVLYGQKVGIKGVSMVLVLTGDVICPSLKQLWFGAKSQHTMQLCLIFCFNEILLSIAWMYIDS